MRWAEEDRREWKAERTLEQVDWKMSESNMDRERMRASTLLSDVRAASAAKMKEALVWETRRTRCFEAAAAARLSRERKFDAEGRGG